MLTPDSTATTGLKYSTAKYADTYAINRLLFATAANDVQGLATANNGVLVTSAGGVPSIGTAIPNGVTATTQSALDNSTKIATTAYVDTSISGFAANDQFILASQIFS